VCKAQPDQRHSALEIIFALIKSASDQEAQSIVRKIRSNHSLEYIAASTAIPGLLLSKPHDGKAGQDNVERSTAEEQRLDLTEEYEEHAVGVGQHRNVSRRRPAKHMLERKSKNTNPPRMNRLVTQKLPRPVVSGKEAGMWLMLRSNYLLTYS
jgi:hypothetical protein